jgi:hypothetical protein
MQILCIQAFFHPAQIPGGSTYKKMSRGNHEFIVIVTDTAGKPIDQFRLSSLLRVSF